jgi:hypothetical protein
MKVFSRYFKVL